MFEIVDRNLTLATITHINKYTFSMKKLRSDIKEAKEKNNHMGLQHNLNTLEIIEEIREIQAKYKLKILNYYYQTGANKCYIEEIDGTKYTLDYKGNLIKDNTWIAKSKII